jgi:cation transport ATPase
MEKIRIRLKLKEEDREIEVSEQETIESMKKSQFPDQRTRVIYQGKELKDHETFLSHGIKSNQAVLHVIIQSVSNNNTGGARTRSEMVTRSQPHPNEGLDNLDLLLLALFLCFSIGWLLIYSIPDLATSGSMSMMTLLSVGLTIALFFRFR